ncbi:MAG: alpha/beta hydrolase-fold protein [Candidatus Saccharimonadales bacterium]
MRDYLFNQSALIFFSAMSSVFCFMVINHTLKLTHGKKRTAVGVAIACIMLVAELGFIAKLFGLHDTPVSAYYIAFVCDVLIVLIVLNWKSGLKGAFYGFLALGSTLMLLALAINSYYHYYPTLSSFFVNSYIGQNTADKVSTSRQNNKLSGSIEKALFSAGQTKGTVTAVNIPGTVSHLATRDAYIYLPPAYSNSAFNSVRFPVLVLLTGTPGSPSSWLQGGQLTRIMDDFASHHEGITPIIVLADHSGSFTNDTECLNSTQGNAETYLTVDVPSFIKQHYRSSSSANNWGVGGFSEGGMCAAMLTLEHQDVYRHFLDIAGDPYPFLNNTKLTLPVLFNGSNSAQKQHNIDWLIHAKSFNPGLTAQFAIGTDDNKRLISEMRQTYRVASQKKIPSTLELIEHEGHTFTTWSRAFSNALPTMSYNLGATACETNCIQ